MSSAALIRILRRDRAVVIAALVSLTVLAWVYIIWSADNMDMGSTMSMQNATSMGAMAPALIPWHPVDFAFMFLMWSIMMIGMMTPSAAPMILIYERVGQQAVKQGRPLAAVGWFTAGYLVAWVGFSLLATFAQWALVRAALIDSMMASTSAVLGGLLLITAGIYQWTPLKDVCLTHCQSPLAFIQQHGGFHRDIAGSLRVGFRHGLYCIGCCWALMVLLFVGGIMNVLWIAALTIFVLIEKIVPAGRIISRSAGIGFVLWGGWLIAHQTH